MFWNDFIWKYLDGYWGEGDYFNLFVADTLFKYAKENSKLSFINNSMVEEFKEAWHNWNEYGDNSKVAVYQYDDNFLFMMPVSTTEFGSWNIRYLVFVDGIMPIEGEDYRPSPMFDNPTNELSGATLLSFIFEGGLEEYDTMEDFGFDWIENLYPDFHDEGH